MNGVDSQTFERRRPKPRAKRMRRCSDCGRPLSTARRPVSRHTTCKGCRRSIKDSTDLLSLFEWSTLRGF